MGGEGTQGGPWSRVTGKAFSVLVFCDACRPRSPLDFGYLSRSLCVEAGFVLEPADDRTPGKDRNLDDLGLSVGVLAVTYEHEDWWVSAGKGSVDSALSWDVASGIWGSEITDERVKLASRLTSAGC